MENETVVALVHVVSARDSGNIVVDLNGTQFNLPADRLPAHASHDLGPVSALRRKLARGPAPGE